MILGQISVPMQYFQNIARILLKLFIRHLENIKIVVTSQKNLQSVFPVFQHQHYNQVGFPRAWQGRFPSSRRQVFGFIPSVTGMAYTDFAPVSQEWRNVRQRSWYGPERLHVIATITLLLTFLPKTNKYPLTLWDSRTQNLTTGLIKWRDRYVISYVMYMVLRWLWSGKESVSLQSK
jgi:hypothetical protein